MKSAEEWSSDVVFDIGTRSGILRIEFERAIRNIQLNAMREGMLRAAKIIKQTESPHDMTALRIYDVISMTSDQLTIKDLCQLK